MSALIEAGAVSVVVALFFVIRAAFYEGYLSALGVASDYNLTPPISVLGAAMVIFTTHTTINSLYSIAADSQVQKHAVGRRIMRTMLISLVVLTFNGVRLELQWPTLLTYGVIGLAVVWLLGVWLLPVIAPGLNAKDYLARLAAFDAKRASSGSRFGLNSSVLDSLGGPLLTRLAFLAFVLVPLGYYLGLKVARQKTEWVVVTEDEIQKPLLGPFIEKKWVLLSRNEREIWVVGVEQGVGITGPVRSFREGQALTLRNERLGVLKPTPSWKPPLFPEVPSTTDPHPQP